MQRLLFYFLGVIVLFNVSCTNTTYTVNATIEGMPVQSYVLEELATTQNRTIDSGATQADGSIKIKSSTSEEALFRIKFEQGKFIILVLKNGDNAIVKGNWNKLENYTVTGSAGSSSIKEFLVNLRENINDMNGLQEQLKNNTLSDTAKMKIEDGLRSINTNFLNYVKKYADTTSSPSCALFAANIINPDIEGVYLSTFFEKLPSRFPNSKTVKAFSEKYAQRSTESTTMPDTEPTQGNPAPDITGTSPDGKTITLSSLRGKYVLLDFWASWCAPCRAENPTVVKAYNQFNAKNFTVLGVSLDTDTEKWKAAIQKDGLAWQHISELKGWESTAARLYKVNSIPTNFLIDPQGNIIATELRGQDLINKLTEVLH